jgi:hypothetical protein
VWNRNDEQTGEISMTSEDEKTVHQLSISSPAVELALGANVACVLAAEVRRLRDELALWQAHAQRAETDLANARNERDGFAAKLARVEELPEAWRRRPGHTVAEWKLADELQDTLTK